MGDRHNIGLLQYKYGAKRPSEILWLYSHSGFWTEKSDGFAACLAEALAEARPRWDDHTYFNRIVINTLGDSISGIGIGTATGDEHRRYVVDSEKQEVYLMKNWPWDGNYANAPTPLVTFTFENFVRKYLKT